MEPSFVLNIFRYTAMFTLRVMVTVMKLKTIVAFLSFMTILFTPNEPASRSEMLKLTVSVS